MYLENVVFDALEPQRLGHFWELAVGGANLTDEPGILETRLSVAGGPALDLCFQSVSEPPSGPPRLQLVIGGGVAPEAEVERLLTLGARRLDASRYAGAEEQSGTLLADPEGNTFRVAEENATYADFGPLVALILDSAAPARDSAFWAWLTGWTDTTAAHTCATAGGATRWLRHPSRRGPVLALRPEEGPKEATKNRRHLDLRLEAGERPDDVAAGIVERGGAVLHMSWGELPWRSYTDPSGNELCVLPAPT